MTSDGLVEMFKGDFALTIIFEETILLKSLFIYFLPPLHFAPMEKIKMEFECVKVNYSTESINIG
jgi:hypothetical protein